MTCTCGRLAELTATTRAKARQCAVRAGHEGCAGRVLRCAVRVCMCPPCWGRRPQLAMACGVPAIADDKNVSPVIQCWFPPEMQAAACMQSCTPDHLWRREVAMFLPRGWTDQPAQVTVLRVSQGMPPPCTCKHSTGSGSRRPHCCKAPPSRMMIFDICMPAACLCVGNQRPRARCSIVNAQEASKLARSDKAQPSVQVVDDHAAVSRDATRRQLHAVQPVEEQLTIRSREGWHLRCAS